MRIFATRSAARAGRKLSPEAPLPAVSKSLLQLSASQLQKCRSCNTDTMNYPKKNGSICTNRGIVPIAYDVKTWFLKILSVYLQKLLSKVGVIFPICERVLLLFV